MGNAALDKLKAKREALDARIRREHAKARVGERKDDTRRKILVGAAMMLRAERDPAFKSELYAHLAKTLERPDDRALFGFPSLVVSDEGGEDVPSDESDNRSAA